MHPILCKNPQCYYVNDWTWADLSVLGTVKELTFTFDGTKKNSFGLTTATYFCMDNLGGEAPEATSVNVARHSGKAGGVSEVYDLGGRRQATMHRGFNVVRMNDGSVRKIVVK